MHLTPKMIKFIKETGSASTLRACAELNRHCYGFEISRDMYKKAKAEMLLQVD